MNEIKMPSIFEYLDYRKYLKDFLRFKKRKSVGFTQRRFSEIIGFKSASFLTYILNGQRNLSPKSINKIVKAIKLSTDESRYFEALVNYNQVVSLEDKTFWFNKLKMIKPKNIYHKLNSNQFKYFENWYYPAIRELIAKYPSNIENIYDYFDKKISKKEILHAVNILEELKLIEKCQDNKYKVKHFALNAEKIPNFILNKVRIEFILRASESVGKFSKDVQHFSSSTFLLTKENFEKVNNMLGDFHNKVADLINTQKRDEGEVYQLNFQLFPLGKIIETKK